MTAVGRDDAPSVAVRSSSDGDPATRIGEADTVDWVAALAGTGRDQVAALRELHSLMIRAAGHQVWRMRAALPDPSPGAVDVIVNQAADEAMTALLGKLHTFRAGAASRRGRSSSRSSKRLPRCGACSGSTARSSCVTSSRRRLRTTVLSWPRKGPTSQSLWPRR